MDEAIRKFLHDLAALNNGVLTPEMIVEAAKDPASPIHEEFEWDDARAAHLHRLNQARTLIRGVRVVEHYYESSVQRPVWMRDPDQPAKKAGYIEVDTLRSDEEKARRALAQELSRVNALLMRSRSLALTLDMTDAIDGVLAQIGVIQEQAQTRVVAVPAA